MKKTILSKLIVSDKQGFSFSNSNVELELEINHEENEKKIIRSGYGRCTVKYCECYGYKPNNPKNEYCSVCGHNYSMHY